MGGRMTSTAAAEGGLHTPDGEAMRGLVFVGFPLHPSGRPGTERARHLEAVDVPMLFLQGDRDSLAEVDLLGPVIAGLGTRASLHVSAGADHGFHVLKRSGRTDDDVLQELAGTTSGWMRKRLAQ